MARVSAPNEEREIGRAMRNSVQVPKAADAISEHIERLILEGVLRPGEKLAAERDLAEKLEVSRPTLRTAIARLADRGLLTTSRSGTRVAQFLGPLMDPLAALLAEKPHVVDDYLEFRSSIEAEATGLAAMRATDVDHAAIKRCIERMKAAHKAEDPAEEANADLELHLCIYEASHNVLFLHIMRAVAELLHRDVFYNREHLYLRKGARQHLLSQHIAIAEAIHNQNSKEAKKVAAEHIDFTSRAIAEMRRSNERMEASLHRIGRADFLASND
ncbi:MAG: FCD domain-containing protein [Pseudomonadota bacterium]